MSLYKIAHIVKDRLPFIWDGIEKVNEWLFVLRYGKKVKSIAVTCVPEGYELVELKDIDTTLIVKFFEHQPEEAYTFLCFFQGKGFRGRMVDVNYRGKGLGTAMNKMLNEVGFGIGLRLFESVSKDNVASYKSALSASNVKVVQELPHNELYLEILHE